MTEGERRNVGHEREVCAFNNYTLIRIARKYFMECDSVSLPS